MTTLYRMFDGAGQLLYVGISSRAALRWEQHRAQKPWWEDVARVEVEHHYDRESALMAEREAILAEKPRHNIAGSIAMRGLLPGPALADELQRPKRIGLRSLVVRWPVAERLAEQFWQVVRSRHGAWAVALVVDGWYPDKRAAQEAMPVWADSFVEGALALAEDSR